MRYAGFWLRFVAYIMDGIVLWVIHVLLSAIFGISMWGVAGRGLFHPDAGVVMGSMFQYTVLTLVIDWLYFALLESSEWQGTLGKMALRICVTDGEGQRITFARATGRYFAKIISGLILCLGYMMAGWTKKKQALHDIMAGTIVMRKE